MTRRIRLGIVAAALMIGPVAGNCEIRPVESRPEVMEIGDPVTISREMLSQEMERNNELRDWIDKYGWPDYSEIQEVAINEPLASYEVRIYYIRRNQELAFSRAFVAPVLSNFGIRMYNGPITRATLDRLLTATPEGGSSAPAAEGDLDREPMPNPVTAAVSTSHDEDPVERMERAVRRMEAAADRASRAAERAEQASARTESSAR